MSVESNVSTAAINELYDVGAWYCDRVYSSHDVANKLVRLTFAETIQGTDNFRARGATVITEAGLASLIEMLVGVQKKLRDGTVPPTLQ